MFIISNVCSSWRIGEWRNKFRQDIPVCWVCGWSSNRRLTRRCVCERWRFSEVTLSSIAAVFMSQDIWDRAAIWLPDKSRKKNRDNDKRWQCSLLYLQQQFITHTENPFVILKIIIFNFAQIQNNPQFLFCSASPAFHSSHLILTRQDER